MLSAILGLIVIQRVVIVLEVTLVLAHKLTFLAVVEAC